MRANNLLLIFCFLLSFTITAQDVSLQEWVNKKQYDAVIEKAGQLTAADSASYETMYAIGQAYEGLLMYRQAHGYYLCCFTMDTANIDMLNTLARSAINIGRAKDAEHYFHQVLERDTANFYANYQLARLYQQLDERFLRLV